MSNISSLNVLKLLDIPKKFYLANELYVDSQLLLDTASKEIVLATYDGQAVTEILRIGGGSLQFKQSCNLLSNVNVILSGNPIIDGVIAADGYRILLISQTNPIQNGIWEINTGGIWVRPADFENGSDAASAYTFIQQGTNYADTAWVCSDNTGNAVVGTDPLTFVQFGNVVNNAQDIIYNPTTPTDWAIVPNTVQEGLDYLAEKIPQTFVFVNQKSDLPTPISGVITLVANYTYFFTNVVDLTGDRLVCGQNTTIIGGSSENCRIKSTGLIGTALITSTASLPLRNITIEANVALNLNSASPTTDALNWFGVNFTDCATIGTIANYCNVILQDSAFLNSANLTIDGTIGTFAATQCLFNANSGGTCFILSSTLTITRRFRVIYSSFIILSGEIGIDTTPPPTIPDDGFILNYCNFAGGGTYLDGFDSTSVKSLFINNVGIKNTSNVGHNYMLNNTTATTITAINTFVKAAGTTTLGFGNSPKWTQPADNRLLYGGVISTDFVYQAVGTIQSIVGNTSVSIRVALNGVTQAESEITVRVAFANQPYPFSIQNIVAVATGDFLEVFVANNSVVSNVTVGDLNVIIQKITG